MERLSQAGMIRAQLSMMDIQVLQKYVCEIEEPNCYLEIGTRWGGSAFFARIAAPKNIKVYSVDVDPQLQFWQQDPSKLGIHFIKSDSVDLAKNWRKDEPIGVLFIDGSHKKAKEDFEAWEGFVAKGGMVLLHDYSLEQEKVVQDCDSIISKYSKRYQLIFRPKLTKEKEKGHTCMLVLKKL